MDLGLDSDGLLTSNLVPFIAAFFSCTRALRAAAAP